jgi:hypothetical protein
MNVLCPPPFAPASPYPSYSFPTDFRSPQNEILSGDSHNINNNNNAQENADEQMLEQPVKNSPSPLPLSDHKPYFQSSTCYSTPRGSPNNYEVKKFDIKNIKNIVN